MDGLWLKDISKASYYFKSLNLRTISHAHCENLSDTAIRERWQFPVFEYKHADTFAHTKHMPLGTYSVKENILDPLKQSTGSVICPLNTRNKSERTETIYCFQFS